MVSRGLTIGDDVCIAKMDLAALFDITKQSVSTYYNKLPVYKPSGAA